MKSRKVQSSLILGVALLLGGVILYYAVSNHLKSGVPPPPLTAPAAHSVAPPAPAEALP